MFMVYTQTERIIFRQSLSLTLLFRHRASVLLHMHAQREIRNLCCSRSEMALQIKYKGEKIQAESKYKGMLVLVCLTVEFLLFENIIGS